VWAEPSSFGLWNPNPSLVFKSIVDWISSTGLRPFLDALDIDAERKGFVDLLNTRVAASYPRRQDGKVLFPFRRLFVVAYR
jgi:trans-aconitate 2-methyltransferase